MAAVTDMARTAVVIIQFVLIVCLSSFEQAEGACVDDQISKPWRNIPRNISAAAGHNERRRQFVTNGFNASRFGRWAVVPLRLIVGYGFIAHGYAKVINGPGGFAAALHSLGVPAPHLMAWVTIVCELVGGLAVLVGAYIPLISLPLSAILLVAAITVHLPNGFSSIKLRAVTAAGPQFGPPGYETNLLYLAALATLVLAGSGPFALDSWLASFRRSQRLKSQ
jgi:putative oxidoreductase